MSTSTSFRLKVLTALSLTTVLLIQAVIYTSCQQDTCIKDAKEASAIIYLHVKSEQQTDATTRVEENLIKDLHILIYDSNGNLIGQKYTTNNTVTINTHSATDCTIYAIANTGTPELFNSYDIHWENNLKNKTYSLYDWNNLTKNNVLPMTGSQSHINIATGNNSLPDITVKRIAAKITLNVNIDQGYGINIDSYRIYGIPNKTYYVLHPLDTESEPTDTQTTRAKDAAIPSQPTDWTDSGSISPNSPTNINTIFYMFENRAGVNTTITQQKEKIKANAPDSATYVVIYGKATGYKFLSWEIYLGATTTTNFNIKRNCNYTYNITLKPTTTDTRVTYKKNSIIWAGSNIYWDGSKLTFDTAISNDSDLKQGVHFRWGSLIGIPSSGNSAPSAYYIPIYNPTSPQNSTWDCKSYDFNSIYCFYNEVLSNSIDPNNTYLNDNALNTDEFYQAYKGDICRYLSKTGAVTGSWRMPTYKEFGDIDKYTTNGNWGDLSTNIYGTSTINGYKTYTFTDGVTRFPASGYWHAADKKQYRTGAGGYYWSSSAYSGNTSSYYLGFAVGYTPPASINARNHAFTIRCVQE